MSERDVLHGQVRAANVRRDLIVIGASAGGIAAMRTLLAGMPAQLPASVIVAIHILPDGHSYLAEAIGGESALPVGFAQNGDVLRHGQVYVVPPDHDVFVRAAFLHVQRCRKPYRFRPSIDALFESAAASHGSRVIGVLLSGMLDDGVQGMIAIKRAGGLVLVQELADAQYPEMPRHVLEAIDVNYQGTAHDLGPVLGQLVQA